MAHTVVDDIHELQFLALTTDGGVIFTDGHALGLLSVGVGHEHWQSELHTHFIVALAQFLQLLFCDVQLLARIEADRVDDAVRMYMFSVCVSTDKDFMTTEVLSQLQSCGVSSGRINIGALRKALHHVVEHRTVRFMVQRFC